MTATDRLREKLTAPKAQPDLPSWMPLASNVLLGLVFVAFIVQAFLSGDAGVGTSPGGNQQAASPAANAPLGATLDGTGSNTTPGSSPSTLELYRIDGSAVQVPVPAASTVRDGVLARLTGNTEGVPSAPGTQPGRSAGRTEALFEGYGNVLGYAQNSTLQLDVRVDPDGPGPDGTQVYTGEAVFHAGTWKFVW